MSDVTTGILRRTKKGAGVLLDPAQSLRPGARGVWVPASLVREHGLVEGATVAGPVQTTKRGPRLAGVESVCGLSPEAFGARTPYTHLMTQ